MDELSLLEVLILGILQGTLEWLPVSSEGQVVLIATQVLEIEFSVALNLALFFHGATAGVILLRFRKDFCQMMNIEESPLIRPILLTTFITAITAIPLLFFIEDYWITLSEQLGSESASGEIVTFFVGTSLIITGIVLKTQTGISEGERIFTRISNLEACLLGFVQGLSVLPGISRSAMTVACLLYIGLKQEEALRGSFIVGFFATLGASVLEIILGNIDYQNGKIFVESTTSEGASIELYILLAALVVTFLLGWISMGILLKMSQEFPFWKFCIIFGLIAVILTAIPILIDPVI